MHSLTVHGWESTNPNPPAHAPRRMATLPIDEPVVTVAEYLRTVYEPDCDYVDGRVEERNVGEYDHGLLQTLLATLFTNNRIAWGVRALTEVRTQVKRTRFRCPDVSVLRTDAPRERILTHPPLIAIEILSPEDRLSRMQTKIDDYIDFGAENVWIIDPETRRAWTADRDGMHIVQSGESVCSRCSKNPTLCLRRRSLPYPSPS